MTYVHNKPIRTLAIDPTSRGLAFAVLEGSERIVDWGLVEAPLSEDERLFMGRVKQLIERYEPAAIAVEALDSARRGDRGRDRISRIIGLAEPNGAAVFKASRSGVEGAFAVSGTTKWEIAVAISRIFPELEPWLPAKRKPWMSEPDRSNIFDAVSFALVGLRRAEREKVE